MFVSVADGTAGCEAEASAAVAVVEVLNVLPGDVVAVDGAVVAEMVAAELVSTVPFNARYGFASLGLLLKKAPARALSGHP